MIYFMVPDTNRQAGGIRNMYGMVDALNNSGLEACVFHAQPGFRCAWFENTTRVFAAPNLALERGDILVVPEVNRVRCQKRVGSAPVVVVNLNYFNTFTGAGFGTECVAGYPGWSNAVGVLTNSRPAGAFLHAALGREFPVYVIRRAVNSDLFRPLKKEKIIAFMPRKRRRDAENVIQLLRRDKQLQGWQYAPIEGMAEAQVAETLGRAAIFLSFSDHEGFGAPPAEAMAAGCYVVGFTGDGGREYMSSEVCSPIDDQNVLAFAQEGTRVAMLWEKDDSALRQAATEGQSLVRGFYTLEEQRKDLAAAFGDLKRPGSPAVLNEPIEITHVSWLTLWEKTRRAVRDFVPPVLTRAYRQGNVT